MRYIFDKDAGEKSFYLIDGSKISSIKEFYEYLDSMEENVFRYHANEDKNDFSNWIKDVYSLKDIAGQVLGKDKKAVKKIIGDWIYTQIHEKHDKKRKENDQVSKEQRQKKVYRISKTNPERIHYKRKDLHNLDKPAHMLTGFLDFLLGFVIGALAMLMMNML